MLEDTDGGHLPISLNLRFIPTDDRVAPYLAVNLAYGICWIEGDRVSGNDYTCYGIAFGAVSSMIDKTAITLEAGVDYYHYDDPIGDSKNPSSFRFTLGLDF